MYAQFSTSNVSTRNIPGCIRITVVVIDVISLTDSGNNLDDDAFP